MSARKSRRGAVCLLVYRSASWYLYHRYSVLVDFKNPQGTPSLYVGADVDAGGVKA